MKWLQWLPFGKVPEIEATALVTELKQVQIVDVRTAAEYASSHLPGAINLPITHFSDANVRALGLDKAIPVIAICLSAHRSIPATRKLLQMGYQARQLKGGMNAWWQQDLPCINTKS